MPDWRELVRSRLAGIALEHDDSEEVIAELAAHLEEAYETFSKRGLTRRDAVCQTLEQVSDWQDLRRKILGAKRKGYNMKKRLLQLWIPGFLTLILSVLFLTMLQRQGVHPHIISRGGSSILFYGPWLAALFLFGFLGAYLSSRAGGSRGTVLLAGAFPTLALTMAFLSMFPIGWFVERTIGRPTGFSTVAIAILRDGIGWLLLPGAALFAGALLMQIVSNARSSTHSTAIR